MKERRQINGLISSSRDWKKRIYPPDGFVTSAQFAKDAEDYLEKKLAGSATQVLLVDGEQLAGMIVDTGLENLARVM